MSKKIMLTSLLICLMPIASFAGFTFAPAITYLEQNVNNNGTESDAKLTIIDLRLGYILESGLYFGGLYSIQDHDMLADSSDFYFGPSIGYYNSGFFFVGTYYLFGERDETNGNGKYAEASGFQLDLSYAVPITSTILIGPQLTYHSVEFGDYQQNGISSASEYEFSGLTPYFNLMFLF